MKVRTTTDLLTTIDSDLSWRKKELRYLANRINGAESESQLCYVRAAVALLYAHWEGFVLIALRAYIAFVSSQRIVFDKLKPELRAAILKTEVRRLEKEPGGAARAHLFRAYEREIGKIHKFTGDAIIVAESNLNSARFLGLIAAVGLNESEFNSASKFLDEALLSKRNSVCHGERLMVDRAGYLSTEVQVIALTEQLKTAIVNAASTRAYKI